LNGPQVGPSLGRWFERLLHEQRVRLFN
jgi:hypothetical protein